MLPNHLDFLERLDDLMKAAAAGERLLALIVARVPVVSRVDALLGYRAGDRLAEDLAQEIACRIQPGDRVWRLDRATLACVLPSLAQPAQAWSAAYRIAHLLDQPVRAGAHALQVPPALGLALFPAHAAEAEALLQRATLAAEGAVHARDRVALYDPRQHEARQRELDLQDSLQQAIAGQALQLAFQPQLRLADGRVTAAETLARWQEPRLGEISPGVFIPALETAGWMPRLTRWLLHTSLRQAAQWSGEIGVAVNLSAQELAEPDLPLLVEQALATWNVAPRRLTLEITETALMADDASVEAHLQALHRLGVRLALDDFGTGHSSLIRLRQLPLDEIKIDLTFVRGLLARREDRHIVQAVIGLGHSLGLTVVAEGVEDAATLAWLTEAGCDLAQGFHIAPPLEATAFASFQQRQPHS